MRQIDIRKKRKSRWPWLLGLVILGLAGWGITILLTPDEEPEPEIAVPTVQDTHPPAALPEPPYEQYRAPAGQSLQDLAPLDQADRGETVQFRGIVVATGNDAFWVLAGDQVLRVDSERPARRGDTLQIAGTLVQAEPDATDRMSPVLERHPDSESWTVVRALKLVEGGTDAAGDSAASASGG